MLKEVHIENFALVEQVDLSFGPGFTVLTGETGAGKSILIDAVEVMLGGRTGPETLRRGAETGVVEGVFALEPGAPATAFLAEAGIAADPDAEPGKATYVFSREFSSGGRTRCRINGRTVTRDQLFAAGSLLVNLHGQHEHQSLLHPHRQLSLLDAFAGEEALARREEVARLYEQLRELTRRWEEATAGEARRAQRIDFLRFQLKEIRDAQLSPGEEEELLRERQLLRQAEKLTFQLERAYAALYGGEGGVGAGDLLGEALAALEELARIDPALEALAEVVKVTGVQVREASRELSVYRDRVDLDPRRLDWIEERLDRIARLKRKYGTDVPAVLAYAEQCAAELAALEQTEESLEGLAAARIEAEKALESAASRLSEARRAAAARLGELVSALLPQLALARARLTVGVSEGEVGPSGRDRIEFLFTANPGEPARPLARIASGGELSRLMLALQTVLARVDATPTLIFDEIDAGISGRAGQTVGECLARLGRERQVVCVTHLPQIASMAEHHYLIAKGMGAKGRVQVSATLLDREGRVAEIARLVGGVKLTPTTLRHAEEMVRMAEERRLKRE
ncbi:MAG: DNA repair protein RecN [Bacillota bacterium]|nr:DNA repair protein RecN [Bacillota bacterium]